MIWIVLLLFTFQGLWVKLSQKWNQSAWTYRLTCVCTPTGYTMRHTHTHTHTHTRKCSHSTYTDDVPTRSANTYGARTHVHTHTHARSCRQHGAHTPSPHGAGLLRAPHRGSDGHRGLHSPPCLRKQNRFSAFRLVWALLSRPLVELTAPLSSCGLWR